VNPSFILFIIFALCGCKSAILVINNPKGETPQAWSDAIASYFVQINNAYAFRSGLGNPEAWKEYKGTFKKIMDPELYDEVDQYMSMPIAFVPPEDHWWMRRGILFPGGDHSWRCRVKRVKDEAGIALYQVDQWVHRSKGSYGKNETVYFTVGRVGHHYRVTNIYFEFDPNTKGVRKRMTPIKTLTEYAAKLRMTKGLHP
jgi:hypothetical protein